MATSTIGRDVLGGDGHGMPGSRHGRMAHAFD